MPHFQQVAPLTSGRSPSLDSSPRASGMVLRPTCAQPRSAEALIMPIRQASDRGRQDPRIHLSFLPPPDIIQRGVYMASWGVV